MGAPTTAPAREDTSLLRTVLDPIPVGVVLFDPEGVPFLANRAARDLLGDLTKQRLETWASSGHFLLPGGQPAGAEDLPPCQTLRDGRAHVEAELCYQRWERSSMPLLVSSRGVCDTEGTLTQVACSLTPIAEQCRRRARDGRRHRMDAIQSLAGSVAGPLNDTLTAIAGYCDLATGRLDPEDPLQSVVTSLREAGERAAVIAGRLLAHGESEVAVPRVLELDRWLTARLPALHAILGDHILLEVGPDAEGLYVKADPRLLEQILADLLTNARQAMPRGGQVRISTGPASRDASMPPLTEPASQSSSAVALSVFDTGGGVPEQALRRVFEPFFTTKEKSLGLGLTTVDRLVRAQGGTVRIDNRRGEGLTFHVLLPAAEAVAEPVRVDEATSATERDGVATVLLVEDDAIVRDLVRQVLKSEGLQVLEARNCAHALRVLEDEDSRAIDLLVCDVVLPGEGGPILARELRGRYPEMPVLFVSGYSDRAVLTQALGDPKTDFLPKPFTPDALLVRVRALLHRPSEIRA